jgi:GT2 family glycosyltransferase
MINTPPTNTYPASASKLSSVKVQIVTWNSSRYIAACIGSILSQESFTLGVNLHLEVIDNASSDGTVDIVRALLRPGISLFCSAVNLGFSAAHNLGIYRFLEGQQSLDALLFLNPDLNLQRDALAKMVTRLQLSERCGLVTPKLLRAGEDLRPLEPAVIDAAGMVITSACRHFDRGSGTIDEGRFNTAERVFGATGACMLIGHKAVRELVIPRAISGEEVFSIYPQLRDLNQQRSELFDEAFFAYREDADLSWRARLFGWECWYEPQAVGFHVRRVTPERRRELPAELNLYGVRNRFLLQINNWNLRRDGWRFFIEGICFRNILVVLGVLISEGSSLGAFSDLLKIKIRAFRIRAWVAKIARERGGGAVLR